MSQLTWRLAPILLQGLTVWAQLLVLIHVHAVCNVQVRAVVARLFLVQHLNGKQEACEQW